MKPLLASLLNLCWHLRPKTTNSFCGERRGTMNCVWTLVQLHYTSQFHTFQGNHQSLQWNVCAAHVNDFSSNLVECVDFNDLSGATVGRLVYKFFRINNIELKCSFVAYRQTNKSWWASHLGRYTLWHNGRRATQLGKLIYFAAQRPPSYYTTQ